MCLSHMAAGLWLAAVTLHDVVEGVSLFGDLEERKESQELQPVRLRAFLQSADFLNVL